MNSKVDFYFQRAEQWQEATQKLREILLDCELTEVLKWGCPCYSAGSANIVLIHVFKEYCALLFFKGALLQDPHGVLVQQSENTQATRQIRFASVQQIRALESILKDYVYEAIAVEKQGLKVAYKKTSEFNMPAEFQQKITENAGLKAAFEALTPGRQRGYLLYFAAAKLAKTRAARIEKHIPKILLGKGLDD
jgi:uncharacterized protein YdeI (YjbR/CyaY-like superfamily)